MRTCLICLLLLLACPLIGQECPTGHSITLSTQEAVDSFPIKYPDCRDIAGDLIIEGDDRDPITSLRGLNGLRSVSGSLFIRSTHLIDLSGLENLESVGDRLSLFNNDVLTSIEGLQNLRRVHSISINGHPGLKNLHGFSAQLDCRNIVISRSDQLESLDGLSLSDTLETFYVSDNPNITRLGLDASTIVTDQIGLRNLPRLKSIASLRTDGSLSWASFTFLDSLQSLHGLESLQSVGFMTIDNCHALTDLDGLQGLQSSSECLFVGGTERQVIDHVDNKEGNQSLKSLDGLESLEEVRTFIVAYNDSLVDISGLRNLESGSLVLFDNNGLRDIQQLPAGGISLGLYIEQNQHLASIRSPENPKALQTLILSANPSLISISGFNDLNRVQGDMLIEKNNQLEMLDGFKELQTIAGSLIIRNNSQLKRFEGFRKLKNLRDQLDIGGNFLLSSLEGLDNIDPDVLEGLRIINNRSLSTCAILSVCRYLERSAKPRSIFGNAPDCNSPEKIQDKCSRVTTAVFDPIESPLRILPNPATELLQLSIQQPGRLRIFSASGQLQLDQVYQPHQPVSIARLPAGMYVARLTTTQGGSYAGRFVKQ